jgi:flagellar assembly factor FliW
MAHEARDKKTEAGATRRRRRGAPATLSFKTGLPGFERCSSWTLETDDRSGRLERLVAREDEARVVLHLIDPERISPGYSEGVRQALGGAIERVTPNSPEIRVVLTVTDEGEASVNLRAPVLLCPEKGWGEQVLLDDEAWPLEHRLLPALV